MSRTHLHKVYRKWVASDDPDKRDSIPMKLKLWFDRLNDHKGEGRDLRNKLKNKIAKRELKNTDQ